MESGNTKQFKFVDLFAGIGGIRIAFERAGGKCVFTSEWDDWYQLCLNKKYRGNLGVDLLKDLRREFVVEFPSIKEIAPFVKGRGYDKVVMPLGWDSI